MKFCAKITVLILAISGTLYSQTPQPTTMPEQDDDVVKISTALIQIDVTVTDKRGRIVSDLKADEFEVFENGKKQEISNFSFVSSLADENKNVAKKTGKDQFIPPPAVDRMVPGQIRRTIALVVDDLTLSSSSMSATRLGLRKYVNEQMLPGDFVAIIKTGGGSGALQQFTSDKRRLNAVIDQLRWNPNGLGGIGAFPPIGSLTGGGIPGREDVISNMFASLKNIISGMKSIPGRKSLMLLSDGFSLTVNPALELETAVRNESDTTTNREHSIAKELIKLANRSSVVIYTMDARGLQYTGATAADNTAILTGVPAGNPTLRGIISGRRNRLAETQSGLKFLAEETGGFAIINNNHIGNGIEKVVRDQSYYLIAYEPGEKTFDPEISKFHKLEIKTTRKNLRVRYRSGFFGTTEAEEENAVGAQKESEIITAIRSPYRVNEVDLNFNTLFAIDGSDKMFVRSFLHIDTNDLTFTDRSDGKKTAGIEILSVSFNDKGEIENQFSKSHKITVDSKKYEEIKRDGLIYFFIFPIKRNGGYEMRVALRDEGSGKTGTASKFLKVPKLKDKRLTLSGIVVENLTRDQWTQDQKSPSNVSLAATPLLDNALGRFKRDTVLKYGFDAYKAKAGKDGASRLSMRTRLYYEGKLIHEGADSPDKFRPQSAGNLSAIGALNLHTDLKLGSYVLQIIVTDKLAKKKNQIATQFVQFEIVQ